ncbi:MAG: tail fiber domain-containing protein [Dokdonella sp.]
MRKLGIFACAGLLVAAQGALAGTITLGVNGSAIPIEVAGSFESAKVTLVGPDGATRALASDAASAASSGMAVSGLADGHYRYRVDLVGAKTQGSVAADPSSGRASASQTRVALPAVEGVFSIAGGRFVPANLVETANPGSVSGSVNSNSSPTPDDQVIPDDLIVQGSICAGLDCVNNENFGFDTVRLKENNTRIAFADTSVGTFAATHWELTANDSTSGGANRFSIMDTTAATIPFTVTGAAPNNSLVIAASGRVGLGTTTPVLRQHIAFGDTPGIRLDQDGSSGFTAQIWDVSGNEANFFIRDVTNGSLLPFRIRPGAPTSSIDIAATGNVGIGTASPVAKLDVSGDAIIRGTLSQLSSRTAKENFQLTDGRMVLAKLEKMPISTWNYRGSDAADRHLGPVAEDFHEAFGLGTSDHFVAPTDLAGVALASVKALQQEISERDQRIADLEKRLHDLEILVRRAAR